MKEFYPEGINKNKGFYSTAFLEQAMLSGEILEAPVQMCDTEHNLIVDLGSMRGVIKREEGAKGIKEGTTRDIALISRVGKSVCFTVTGFDEADGKKIALLSRRKAQEMFLSFMKENLKIGSIIKARVTHLDSFGAFCDIGCGVAALLPIDCISVSRISHPSDRFSVGNEIKAVIKAISSDGKVTLSHKELLGTWEENVMEFSPHQTVSGVVRSVEDYGVFVELAPNLAGLAELAEGVKAGDTVGVYIKNIIPEKMKVKLIIIDVCEEKYSPKIKYFKKEGVIDRFEYSPKGCEKQIFTDFCEDF
ncbi:MAG: 30S ribosomal protein S1 [Ruminococcaceae bacterium]|nr:30S ribosomal protein S1 [Oscillospiraceae bacterium]